MATEAEARSILLTAEVPVSAWLVFRALDMMTAMSAHHHPDGKPCKADTTILFLAGLLLGAVRKEMDAYPETAAEYEKFRDGISELLGRRGLAYGTPPGSKPDAYRDDSPGPACEGRGL